MKQSPTFYTLPAGRKAAHSSRRAGHVASTGGDYFIEFVLCLVIGATFALACWAVVL